MLTRDIAQEIVQEMMIRLKRNIHIMDETGTIIASGDHARINQYHEGAAEVIRTRKPMLDSGIYMPIEFQGKIIGVIGIIGDTEDVEGFGGIAKMVAEIMINQKYLIMQTEWKIRTRSIILKELIKPNPDETFLNKHIHLLELKLSPPHYVAVIKFNGGKLRNQMLVKIIDETITEGEYLLCFMGVEKIVILFSGQHFKQVNEYLSDLQNNLMMLGLQFKIGLSTETAHRHQIANIYDEAETVLLISTSYNNEIIDYSEVDTQGMLYQINEESQLKYTNRVLWRLNDQVLETLNVFLNNNLNITAASNELFIHRNTLIYRLKRVKELTGYDPTRFQDALKLQLAIWMRVCNKQVAK